MSVYQSKTASLYNAGLELEDAIKQGADRHLFLGFENEFKGGSIPAHLLHGFKYKAPYSCDYHTGGKQGEMLRNIIKQTNKVESHAKKQMSQLLYSSQFEP